MKTKPRWMLSILSTAKKDVPALPFNRKVRAAVKPENEKTTAGA
ncbi:MAG: hypothetical protein OXQ92_04075 [Boseongicola sp.]|nr:hypothetical protein [Boseongicola sp.]MDD9976526.1 hypothetical protein [Boseongicola sp.]